jgi:hypothetical protein
VEKGEAEPMNNNSEVRPSAGNRVGLAHSVAVAKHGIMMLVIVAGFMLMIAVSLVEMARGG